MNKNAYLVWIEDCQSFQEAESIRGNIRTDNGLSWQDMKELVDTLRGLYWKQNWTWS